MTLYSDQRAGVPADGYRFIGEDGDFVLANPQTTSYLYFPLANEAGMMSAVTPLLAGDAKIGHNAFLLEPVSAENLHNSRSTRNFWLYLHGHGTAWSATGVSAPQAAARLAPAGDPAAESVTVSCGMLWQTLTRENTALGLRSEVVSYVPADGPRVELMRVRITNTGTKPQTITPTAAVPIYGRSAESLRDHRHVTALLHRIRTVEHGVIVTPSMCFDERGHTVNTVSYSVLGAEGDGKAPIGFFPVALDFVGEGGSYDWPEAVVSNAVPTSGPDAIDEGFEAIGALRFADITLAPGDSASYVLALSVQEPGDNGPEA
jgi:cellobiose phosphorylase